MVKDISIFSREKETENNKNKSTLIKSWTRKVVLKDFKFYTILPAMLASSFIITGIVINQSFIQLIAATGVLLYGCVGLASFLNGGNFFDYNVLSKDPIAGQHLGIILIEWGVGCTVASVMFIIFFNFARRREMHQNKDNKNQESS